MRALLVNPPWPYPKIPVNRRRFTPPLGLAYLAAVLERAGIPVIILDMAPAEMRPERVRDYVTGVGLVGISANMTFTVPNALAVARHVKGAGGGSIVVLGGNHATFESGQLLRDPAVDAVCLGEGEMTFLEVAQRALAREPLAGCPGVASRDGGGSVVVGPARPRAQDLDRIPLPARHLLPMHSYDRQGQLVSSRGCPFSCSYCSTSAYNGNQVRWHSLKRVLGEIEILTHDYGCREVMFTDDIFGASRPRLMEFCRLISINHPGVKWTCNTRTDNVDYEMLRTMRDAGCLGILLGIESANRAVLEAADKRLDIEHSLQVFAWCRELGIRTKGTFIIGLPGETPASTKRTADFIRRARPDVVTVNILMPFPGTPVRERAKELGVRVLSHDYGRYDYASPTCATETMSPDDIRRAWVTLQLAAREVVRGTCEA